MHDIINHFTLPASLAKADRASNSVRFAKPSAEHNWQDSDFIEQAIEYLTQLNRMPLKPAIRCATCAQFVFNLSDQLFNDRHQLEALLLTQAMPLYTLLKEMSFTYKLLLKFCFPSKNSILEPLLFNSFETLTFLGRQQFFLRLNDQVQWQEIHGLYQLACELGIQTSSFFQAQRLSIEQNYTLLLCFRAANPEQFSNSQQILLLKEIESHLDLLRIAPPDQEQQYLQVFISTMDKDFGVLAYQQPQTADFDQSCHLQELVMHSELLVKQFEHKLENEISLSQSEQQLVHTLSKALKTWTLQNNRTQIRTHCRFHAKIKNQQLDSPALAIRLINLSLNGACLELDKEQLQWDVGDQVLVTTPENVEHLAVVRWIRSLEESVTIGVLFEDQRGQLLKVVSQY